MSRVVVVLPLVPLTVGDSFLVAAWPLHITVVPPFATEAPVPELEAALATAIGDAPAIAVRAVGDDLFGRRHTIPVTLIDDNERLTALQRRLVAAMRGFASTPDDRAFSGPEFRPHVTVKGENRVHNGDDLLLRQVALVDMAPRR
jgi:2'-5' RNA ligase